MLLAFIGVNQLQAQVKRDSATGNWYHIPKDSSYVITKSTYTDRSGKVYPVYLSKKGKPFVFKISQKSGKQYRYYLYTGPRI